MSNTIKLPDYNFVENLNDTDILLINQSGQNKKVTKEKLLEDINVQIEGVNASLNDIANERGYLNTKVLDSLDWRTLKQNGRYKVTNVVGIDNSTENTFLIDVFSMNDSYLFQKAYCLYSNTGNNGKSYINSMENGVWSQYKEFVTTEQKEITLLNGWTRETGSLTATKIGKKVFLDFNVTGGIGVGLPICNLPYHNKNEGELWNIGVQDELWAISNVNLSIVNSQLMYWSEINKRVPIHICYETN